jgi:hypothetical protein
MMLKRPFLSAVVLTFFTFLISLAVGHLPYSETRDLITDSVMLPGAFVASLVYPEGVHTGHGAPNWGLLVALSNIVVYVLFWYACLKIIGLVHRRKHRYDALKGERL